MAQTAACQMCKATFLIDDEDLNFYTKMDVPLPTFCPECRLIRRMRMRNERGLYKRDCMLCKKSVFSAYHPDTGYKILCRACYSSSDWNPLDYGVDYDFSKPFFVQLAELQRRVPHRAGYDINAGKGTEFSNQIFHSEDAFLSYSVTNSQRVMYSRSVDNSRDIIDSYNVFASEKCYYDVQGHRNYGSTFLIDSRDCVDCHYLYDCANSTNCFMSSNLRNRSYVFRNEQLTKEAYNEAMKNVVRTSRKEQKKLLEELRQMKVAALHKFAAVNKVTNSTGDYIENCKNARDTFDSNEAENVRYCMRLIGPKDYYDVTGSGKGELLYEVQAGAWDSRNIKFASISNATTDSEYFEFCLSCQSVFGCVSLQSASYCILNKQYTKEEYAELVPKIRAHMNEMPYVDEKGITYTYGEHFPQICIPYGYNETVAQEYFPLTESEARERGYLWREREKRDIAVTKDGTTIPDDIRDTEDSIVRETMACAHKGECKHQCTMAFRVIPDELSYYRAMNVPIPDICPNCRHFERLSFRNPVQLWHRACMNEGCTNEFETTYAPERPEVIFCESCYQKEVI